MSDAEPFQILSPSEFEKLPLDRKLAYLQRAFRQSCAAEPSRSVSDEAAQQSAAAESKI